MGDSMLNSHHPHARQMANGGHGGEGSSTDLALLQTDQERRLLDAIEDVRKYDIKHEIELPQLVVCGKQSSGKSSVLEAISRIPFPRKSGICTRFATVIRFSRMGPMSVTVEVEPGIESEKVQASKPPFRAQSMRIEDLPNLIDQATQWMGVSDGSDGGGPGYSKDVLKLEVRGSTLQLTLVDIPGLIQSDNRQGEDARMVEEINDRWIGNKRSIILAVISANDDLQNQGVLHKAKTVDPKGQRTFSIITRPDTEHLESHWVDIALNKDPNFKFTKGWHVLLNRNPDEVKRGTSADDRDRREEWFFRKEDNIWKNVPGLQWGIGALRERLSKLLLEHTETTLPEVRRDIENRIGAYEDKISELNKSLKTRDEMWIEFQLRCNQIVDIVRAAADGTYINNAGYFNINDKDNFRFLRRRIQKESDLFYERMIKQGHGAHFAWDDPELALDNSALIDEIQKQLDRTLGAELPGQGTSPQRLDLFFQSRSDPWKDIAEGHVGKTFDHCTRFLNHICSDVLATSFKELFHTLWREVISEELKMRRRLAIEELEKLEKDRLRPASTRNRAFLQQSQQAKNETLLKLVLRAVNQQPNANKAGSGLPLTPNFIAEKLERDTPKKQHRGDAEAVLKDMLIYYNVARDAFVDNVLNQVVERHLVADLHQVFWNSLRLSREVFYDLWKEDDGYAARQRERQELEARRESLEKCLEKLKAAL